MNNSGGESGRNKSGPTEAEEFASLQNDDNSTASLVELRLLSMSIEPGFGSEFASLISLLEGTRVRPAIVPVISLA